MTFNEYDYKAGKTAIYPRRGNNLQYPALKLCSEAGEVAGKVGKMDRDDGGVLTEERRQQLIDEVGDVLWYLSALAFELDTALEIIAARNIVKLTDRAARNVIGGDGDQR